MRPFDDASLRRCVPSTMRPVDDVSLGRRVPDRCVPALDCLKLLDVTSQFGSGHVCPGFAPTVLSNPTQHKVSLSQMVRTERPLTRHLRGASSTGHVGRGTHRPRDAISKGSIVQRMEYPRHSFGDTTVGDAITHYTE